MLMTVAFAPGCANESAERKDDDSWVKEVVIVFRSDTGDFVRRQFYSINYLEFLSQYDNDTVLVRIISGESIADFIDRVSDDPIVVSVEPAD
jgi:hypothetical protein